MSHLAHFSTTYNIPEEEERWKVFLVDRLSVFADVINDKHIGTYRQDAEVQNGFKFFYDTTKKTRNGFQVVARIPQFPNAGVLVLNATSSPAYPLTDVNPEFVITHVWGSASRPCSAVGAGDGDYFSFMAQGDTRISFVMTDTTITITTTIDMTAYSGFIIIEFLRDGL